MDKLVFGSLLVGLTPLIPVPFVDDWVRGLLMRSLIAELARDNGFELERAHLDELVREPESGCCLFGMLGGCVLYPLKRVLRKIFVFLEWKRASDGLARTWAYSLLLRTAFEEGWRPGDPTLLKQAAEAAMAEVGTSPVEHAVSHVFNSARRAVLSAVRSVANVLRKLDPRKPPDDLTQQLNKPELAPVTQQLSDELSHLPEGYLKKLVLSFFDHLGKLQAEAETKSDVRVPEPPETAGDDLA